MAKHMCRKNTNKEDSWKPLFHIYRSVKIPWIMLALVVLISLGSQYVAIELAKYTAKIDTGTMTGGSFLVGFVIFTMISVVLEYGYDLANGIGRAQMGRNVRKKLWGRLLRLPVSNYEKEEPQHLVSRMTKDTDFAYGALTAVIQLFSMIYGVIIAMIEVVRIFGAYSWIMAAVVPVLIICSFIVGKIQYRIDRMINTAYARMTNFYSERLPNITYIKTNNMEKSEYEKGIKISNEKYKADMIYKGLYALQLPLQSLANYISLVFVLLVASSLVRAGSMESVQMKELLNYFDIVMSNATLILGVWQTIKATHGGSEKIAELNAARTEQLSGKSFDDQEQQDIVFDGVSFGYNEEKLILKNVSFHIPKGKITAIVGENGSGKSTITRLLERFDEPDSGEIRIGEQRLKDIDGMQWRDHLGYVFQGNQMVQGTVRENLTYGVTRECSQEELVKVTREAEAYQFIMEKEKGFDTPMKVFDSEFSGGQLQRLAIARVLLKDPDYLIMDEATSGVDHIKEDRIIRQVKEKMKGKTVIVISHNMNLVKSADHIVVIRDGKVEAEGSPKNLAVESNTFRAFLNADTSKEAV